MEAVTHRESLEDIKSKGPSPCNKQTIVTRTCRMCVQAVWTCVYLIYKRELHLLPTPPEGCIGYWRSSLCLVDEKPQQGVYINLLRLCSSDHLGQPKSKQSLSLVGLQSIMQMRSCRCCLAAPPASDLCS